MRLGTAIVFAGMTVLAATAPLFAQVPTYHAVVDPTFQRPDLELGPQVGLRVDRRHFVYLTDRSVPAVYRLSPDGSASTIVLREGGGPGEMRDLSVTGWRGDTLWLFDNRLSRFTFLGPDGAFLRTESYDHRCLTAATWGLLSDGGCLETIDRRFAYARAGEARPPLLVLATGGGRTRADTLGTIDFTNILMQFDFKDGGAYATQPFGSTDIVVLAADGSSLVWIEMPRATGVPDTFRLRRWTPGAGWIAERGIGFVPRPLPGSVVDSAISAMADGYRKSRSPVTIDSLRRRVHRPKFYPPVAGVVAASDGTTWLRIHDQSALATSRAWLVFNRDMKLVARVTTPASFRVQDGHGELIWGTELDEDDVPGVVRYMLIRD